MWDAIAAEFPSRFHQFSATEQLGLGAAVGMAQDGLIPIVYSITPFLLFRPAEIIRLYLDGENANVKLLAAGRCEDGISEYEEDGPSHNCCGDKEFLALFANIKGFWPQTLEDLKRDTETWLYNNQPSYLNLKR